MRCKDVMNSDVECIFGTDPVHEAATRMRDRDIGFLPVVDAQGLVVGTLTDRDIAIRIVAAGLPATTSVVDCMSREVIGCFDDDDLHKAEDLMALYQKSRIVVLDDHGQLSGVISIGDVARVAEDDVAEMLHDVKSDFPMRETVM